MDDLIKGKLKAANVDLESAMDRFLGNEDLLLRFLREFPEDENYGIFRKAMDEKRYQDAFKAAHTFKGVCGNLSLVGLFDVMSREVECLRSGDYGEAMAMYPEIMKEYDKTAEILRTL